jgi:hypothetical protein
MASVGARIFGSSRSSTRISPGACGVWCFSFRVRVHDTATGVGQEVSVDRCTDRAPLTRVAGVTVVIWTIIRKSASSASRGEPRSPRNNAVCPGSPGRTWLCFRYVVVRFGLGAGVGRDGGPGGEEGTAPAESFPLGRVGGWCPKGHPWGAQRPQGHSWDMGCSRSGQRSHVLRGTLGALNVIRGTLETSGHRRRPAGSDQHKRLAGTLGEEGEGMGGRRVGFGGVDRRSAGWPGRCRRPQWRGSHDDDRHHRCRSGSGCHQGSPGSDPENGDLIYFVPWGNLGFYYNTEGIGYSDQTLHLGTYDATVEQLGRLEGQVTAQIVP